MFTPQMFSFLYKNHHQIELFPETTFFSYHYNQIHRTYINFIIFEKNY